MCKWMTLLTILAATVTSGCNGAHGAQDSPRPLARRSSPVAWQSMSVPGEAPEAAPSPYERRQVRTIEDDPDADGIANYRVIITDTFDAAGNMVSTLREEDFEADGIIDARVMTSFGG